MHSRPRAPAPPSVVAFALFGAVSVVARPAEAHGFPETPDNLFLIGPSLSGAPGEGTRSGFLAGVDATLTATLFWGSVGARTELGEPWNVYPYVETGLWFLVNFGVGYSVGLGREAPRHNWHWFVGLPIPLSLGSEEGSSFGGVILEPYYRPMMDLDPKSPAPTLHELGLLMKWMWEVRAGD